MQVVHRILAAKQAQVPITPYQHYALAHCYEGQAPWERTLALPVALKSDPTCAGIRNCPE